MKNDFSKQLLKWFAQHGRKDLPWQKDMTPYRVWISEIMLQQTQVVTVIPFYEKFMRSFPDIKTLAQAPLDHVLHHWSGLGYYARARNLHKCAQTIANEFNGVFPQDIETVVSLPGIGRSTAGAILSLAYKQHHAILDGNVKRVLTRYFAIDGWPGTPAIEKQLWQLAEQITPKKDIDKYTQAIMDLGATLCTRSHPSCDTCPVRRDCIAHAHGNETAYPSSKPKKDKPVQKTAFLVITNPHGEIFLEKRPPSGIWGGLWSFPEWRGQHFNEKKINAWCLENFGFRIASVERKHGFRHTFSHYHLDITPVHAKVTKTSGLRVEDREAVWYNLKQPEARGLAAPVTRILNELIEE